MVEILAIVILVWLAIGTLIVCHIIDKSFEDNGNMKEKTRLAEMVAAATDDINWEKDLDKLKQIYKDIEEAQKEGRYAIGGDGYLGEVIKKELKCQGFKVHIFRESGDYWYKDSYLITWDKYRKYR